jgi:hypothetical protein
MSTRIVLTSGRIQETITLIIVIDETAEPEVQEVTIAA